MTLAVHLVAREGALISISLSSAELSFSTVMQHVVEKRFCSWQPVGIGHAGVPGQQRRTVSWGQVLALVQCLLLPTLLGHLLCRTSVVALEQVVRLFVPMLV